MNKRFRCTAFPAACILAVWLTCTAAAYAQPQAYHDRFVAFGTLVEIIIHTDDATLAHKAFRILEGDFAEWHVDWHAWNPGKLQRLNNRLAGGEWVQAPDLAPLVARARALSKASIGLFNPAIGRLVELWGFNGGGDHRPPSAAAVARLMRQPPDMGDLVIDGARVRSDNPTVMLDFGGFAKGYAIDQAIETLKGLGVEHAIVSAGGDLRAIGRHGERPWGIGIRHPRVDGLVAWLEIEDGEAVFTSGDYERFFIYQGKRYQHIIDPRNGYPVSQTVSATVVHHQGDLADAAATALVVAGPDEWVKVAHSMGIDQAMIIDADGRIYISPRLADRIRFAGVPAEKIQVANDW